MKGLSNKQKDCLSQWLEKTMGKTIDYLHPIDDEGVQRFSCEGETNPGWKLTIQEYDEEVQIFKLYNFADTWLKDNPTGERDVYFRWRKSDETLECLADNSVISEVRSVFQAAENANSEEKQAKAIKLLESWCKEYQVKGNIGGNNEYLKSRGLSLPPSSEAWTIQQGMVPNKQAGKEGTRVISALIVPYSPFFDTRKPTAMQYRRAGRGQGRSFPHVSQTGAFCILQKGEPVHGTNKQVVLLSESASTGLAIANAAKDATVICSIGVNHMIEVYDKLVEHYKDNGIIIFVLDKKKDFVDAVKGSKEYEVEEYAAKHGIPVLQLDKHEEGYRELTDFCGFKDKFGLPVLRAYLTSFLKRVTPEAPEVTRDEGSSYELVNFNGAKKLVNKRIKFLDEITEDCVSSAYLKMIWSADRAVITDEDLAEYLDIETKGLKGQAITAKKRELIDANDKAKIKCIKRQFDSQLSKHKSQGRAIGIFGGTEREAFIANGHFGTVKVKHGDIKTSARRRPEGTHYYEDFTEQDAPDLEAAKFTDDTLRRLKETWDSIYGRYDKDLFVPVMGWATQACLAGVGKFRAHAAINGTTGSGKSTLAQQLLEPLLCGLFRFFPKATVAGIAQVISTKGAYQSHQAICLDEFDKSTPDNKKIHDAVSNQMKISATTLSKSGSVHGSKEGVAVERDVRQAYMTNTTESEWRDLQDKKRAVLFYLRDNAFASQNQALEELPARIESLKADFVKGVILAAEFYPAMFAEVREQMNHYVKKEAQLSHMVAMLSCCLAGYGSLRLLADLEKLGLSKKDMIDDPKEERKHIRRVAKKIIAANQDFVENQISQSNDMQGIQTDVQHSFSMAQVSVSGSLSKELYTYLLDKHNPTENNQDLPVNMTVIAQTGMFAQEVYGKRCVSILSSSNSFNKAVTFLSRHLTRETAFEVTKEQLNQAVSTGDARKQCLTLPDGSRKQGWQICVDLEVADDSEEEITES